MSSSLVVETGVASRGSAHRRDRHPIPWADPSPCDSYDQAPGRYACTDETGRRRPRHEYLIESRDGARCLWCGCRA